MQMCPKMTYDNGGVYAALRIYPDNYRGDSCVKLAFGFFQLTPNVEYWIHLPTDV
jgi:hypothetical protein